MTWANEDCAQRRQLALPRGELLLRDGRLLRPILGYDIRKLAANKATVDGILASAGWEHRPSGFVVSAGVEDTDRWGPLLHVSMSYQDHDPGWDEIRAVRELFFPADMDAIMVLPRKSD